MTYRERVQTFRQAAAEAENRGATIGQHLAHFVWECWRMIWPLAAIAVILWHFQAWRLYYFDRDLLEPAWLGTLKRAQNGLIGLLVGHITRSGTFPYIKLRWLMTHDVERFRIVFPPIVYWYIGWVVGLLLWG